MDRSFRKPKPLSQPVQGQLGRDERRPASARIRAASKSELLISPTSLHQHPARATSPGRVALVSSTRRPQDDDQVTPTSFVSSDNELGRDPLPLVSHNMKEVWHEALCQYRSIAGVDLNDKRHSVYRRLEGCTNYLDIVNVLDEIANEFELYRHPTRGIGPQIRGALRSIVQTILSAGVVDLGGEAAAASSLPGGKAVFVAVGVLLQATKGVSDRFDAAMALLEQFETCLTRLDLRVDIPLSQASRQLTVKILVEMLSATALVTQMMSKTRSKHFMPILLGRGCDVSGVSRRIDSLMRNDGRFTLEEVHHKMHTLAQSLASAFDQVNHNVARLDDRVESLRSDLSAISTNLQIAGVYDLRRLIMRLLASVERENTGSNSNASRKVQPTDALSIAGIPSFLRSLTHADQAAFQQIFDVIAATVIRATVGGNLDSIWYAVVMNPATFMVAFLPLAAAYAATYICWRHLMSPILPQAPRCPQLCTIVIIDFLGLHVQLPVEMVESWEEVHSFLLEHFANRQGARYVQSRSYAFMSTDQELSSIIEPTSWARSVQAGMTLEMSIVIHQSSRFLHCPWCKTVTSRVPYDGWIQCAGCARQYWATNDTKAEMRDIAPKRQPHFNTGPSCMILSLVADGASMRSLSKSEVDLLGASCRNNLPSPRTEEEVACTSNTVAAVTHNARLECSYTTAALDADSSDLAMVKKIAIKHSHMGAAEMLAKDTYPYDRLEWQNLQHEETLYAGSGADLDASLLRARFLLDQTTNGDSSKPERLYELGTLLRYRFICFGHLCDIDEAVIALTHAIELTPAGEQQLKRLYDLGVSLHHRMERTGAYDDLETVVAIVRHAIDAIANPNVHIDMPTLLNNLGVYLHCRYDLSGDIDDLRNAVSALRRAIEITPYTHHERSARLNNLGIALRRRYERFGGADGLDNGEYVPYRSIQTTYGDYFDIEQLEEVDDHERAIEVASRDVENTQDHHFDKPARLGRLSEMLMRRYQRTRAVRDLDDAIVLAQQSIELGPDDAARTSRLGHLGECLWQRFQSCRERDDLANAVSVLRVVVELTPDGHLARAMQVFRHARCLQSLFEEEPSHVHFDAAFQGYMTAITQPSTAPPSYRIQAAVRCGAMLLDNPRFISSEAILSMHSLAMQLVPQVVGLGYSVRQRYKKTAALRSVAASAVSAAITHGSLSQAVQWFEEGRSIVWSQFQMLRTPLNQLAELRPDLARELRDVSTELLAPFLVDVESNGAEGDMANRRHQLADYHERLLVEARGLPGFEDFLRPPRHAAILSSLMSGASGPLVLLNVDRTRCDAVIISSRGALTSVYLPEMSMERAQELCSSWMSHLHAADQYDRSQQHFRQNCREALSVVLQKLWDWVVHPILLHIDLSSQTIEGFLPHITWCPSGPLMQLPFHAAGVFDDNKGPRAIDFIVSSYVPSFSAYLRCCNQEAKFIKERTAPSALILTQPANPSDTALLPGSEIEGVRIQRILSRSGIATTLLNHDQVTVKVLKDIVNQHPWVHFACHGSQDRHDATQSAFELYDGPLSLLDLLGTVTDNAELAFLSACQTATGDERNLEESAHLAAGMLAVGFKGVIASLWEISDTEAPIVVEAYYKTLLELRASDSILGKCSTGAAYALHDAIRKSRDVVGEGDFASWASFVHFGV